MVRFLTRRITGPAFDNRFAWVAGFTLLVFCSTLALKMLPELNLFRSTLVVGGISAAWLVIGNQMRHLRASRYRR